jgi:segregation and condensation protein A
MNPEAADPFHVQVGEFEGALDLLLHLVRRHEVPIEDVPLAEITAEYVQTLEFLATIDLEPAAEFLEVAATLLRLKARALLPRPEAPEDPLAAAAEESALLQQLVEHQVVRMAAKRLRHRESQAASVWFRGEPEPGGIEASEEEVVEADLFALVTAFKSVLAGLEQSSPFEVSREDYPVAASRAEILARVAGGQPVPFLDLFEPGIARDVNDILADLGDARAFGFGEFLCFSFFFLS